jgi:hypothetical protein
MSATDELRRLLDERGVEWRERVWGGKHSITTFWHARGVRWHYRENRFGEVRLHADGIAPEQAIAATLGRGTCQVKDSIIDTYEYNRWEYELSCGHTIIWEDSEPPNYCPNCGRRIVDPTTNDVDAEVDA